MRNIPRILLLALVLGVTTAAFAGTLRDPTRPPGGAAAKPADPAPRTALHLDFLVASMDRRLARINGQWVREGDTVAGAKVLRIAPNRVVVLRRGQTRVLRLGGSGIRKNTNGKR